MSWFFFCACLTLPIHSKIIFCSTSISYRFHHVFKLVNLLNKFTKDFTWRFDCFSFHYSCYYTIMVLQILILSNSFWPSDYLCYFCTWLAQIFSVMNCIFWLCRSSHILFQLVAYPLVLVISVFFPNISFDNVSL
jgi:hypothetical protein